MTGRSRWIVGSLLVAVGLAACLPLITSVFLAHTQDPRAYIESHLAALRCGIPIEGQHAADGFFLARDVTISGPHDVGLNGQYDDERQFVVEYTSPWRSEIGEYGRRTRFVYLGRDAAGEWQVLGSGTGP